MSSLFAGLSDARLYAAGAIALSYAAASTYFLWPRRSSLRTVSSGARTVIAYASQTGFAEQVARQTAAALDGAGTAVDLVPLGDLDFEQLHQAARTLFVVSTTGEGDAPDPAARFVRATEPAAGTLEHLDYAVLALGDREYANFCAFGHRLDGWLRHRGARPLFDVVEVDNGDEGALRHWQHQLSVLAANPDMLDWQTGTYERWLLRERRLLNPGSAGAGCFHLALTPVGPMPQWRAGDIAEIDPENSTWRTGRQPLPHREYSIASIPADGAIHLLVRDMRRANGQRGLGSGWLTEQTNVDEPVALRIRSNANFHVPQDARGIVCIGNGTGIAGLRGLLKERIALGRNRNWLIFGERNAAQDAFYRDELDAWQRSGALPELDLVFSRDQPERRYVQQRILERATLLREWIAAGASIYVCGSLQGMAPAVDAALREVLGEATLEQLVIDGRYRRDVY